MQIKLTLQSISQESNILGLSRDDLFSLVSDFETQPKRASMRVNQLWSWIYCHGMSSFDNMTNIDKSLRSKLQKVFNISRPAIEKKEMFLGHCRNLLQTSGNVLEKSRSVPGDFPELSRFFPGNLGDVQENFWKC